ACYAAVRGFESRRPGRWQAAAVLACAIGMMCKGIMVTAPIMIALFDRLFVATSWRALWAARRRFYLGLASTWIVLVLMLLSHSQELRRIRGLLSQMPPLDYAR